MAPDDDIEVEESEYEEYEPQPATVVDGDVFMPDPDALHEALGLLGVVPLAYQHRDGQLYVLIACQNGFKWTDIESIGKAPERRLRPVQ